MSSDGPSRANGAIRRVGSAAALMLALSACSWFSRTKPPVAARIEPPVSAPPVYDDAQPPSAARSACANYGKAFEESTFPRDAVMRGVDGGNASVRFRVEGTTVTVLTVTSSDPAFGDAAVRIVRRLECRVDRPTTFEIPFAWRSTR